MTNFNVIFLGDVVGKPGRRAVVAGLTKLREKYKADFVIINAENAAKGSGINERTANEIFAAQGVNILTLGDHAFRRKGIFELLNNNDKILRPLNLVKAPGIGFAIVEPKPAVKVAVINLIGRIFMNPAECPFKYVSEALDEIKRQEVKLIFVDFHAEATSEKIAMGYYLDGKVTALIGTHTHVQTADEKILPCGTAYITDAGMCGPQKSVLGRSIEDVLEKFTTGIDRNLSVASEENELQGIFVRADEETGHALEIERIKLPVSIS